MLNISIIIPVFNRPDETAALLDSLCSQTDKTFEVIIVEDGSDLSSEKVIKKYDGYLDLKYYYKENSGPGLSRNFGVEKSSGNYFLFFDSDCIIPENYIEVVRQRLTSHYTDAFGGPDQAHASFSPMQKAINFSMTSFITTGGIRGKKKGMEKFHPRSFNMGFSKAVFESTKGFSAIRFGEDIDLSIRIYEAGFSAQLIEEAYVYHKRRTDLKKFYKQVYNSGIARINLFKLHPKSLKPVHFLPAVFLLGCMFLILLALFHAIFIIPLFLFIAMVFFDALVQTKQVVVAFLAILTSFIQLGGYGAGFIAGCWHGLVLRKENYNAFSKNFYK